MQERMWPKFHPPAVTWIHAFTSMHLPTSLYAMQHKLNGFHMLSLEFGGKSPKIGTSAFWMDGNIYPPGCGWFNGAFIE